MFHQDFSMDLLLKAIKEADFVKVQSLVQIAKSNQIDLNIHTKKYITPLHWAILQTKEETQDEMLKIMDVLYQAGIDLNKGSSDSKNYHPIHSASRRGLPKIVTWLLENGTDLSVKDAEGTTALEFVRRAIQHKQKMRHTGQKEASEEVIARLLMVQRILQNPPAPKKPDSCSVS